MSRWVIAIALSWAAWVAAQPGVAHARPLLSSELGAAMCGDGSQAMSFEDFALGRLLTTAGRARFPRSLQLTGAEDLRNQTKPRLPGVFLADDPRVPRATKARPSTARARTCPCKT